jgi:cytoplasmic iron level regulating protein YaaA (DUF328/UPF0246 family)
MASSANTPVILLPPSEGKAQGGEGLSWKPATMAFDLDADRERVLRAAFGAKAGAFLAAPTMPAIERYTGVLYKELAYRALTKPLRTRVDKQVLIFSGLWGLVAPQDPIPYYKLKMSASAGKLGKLATWWRPRITPVLDTFVAGRTVWDLLPNEHLAAWPVSEAPALRIRAKFLDEVQTGRTVSFKTVSHWNKLLKGSLVRYVVAHQATDVAGLRAFSHPEGYVLRPELTESNGGFTTVAFVKPA